MASKAVSTDHASATNSKVICLSLISNGQMGIRTTVASLDKKQTENTDVEHNYGQCFNSMLSFSIMFGAGFMFTFTVNTYLSSQITTIEKVFGLSSLKSGLLLSANDIGFLVTVLFAAHFLHRYHIPRILAVSILIIGVSGIFLALPKYFVSDAPVVDQSAITNSSRNQTTNLCVRYNVSELSEPLGFKCRSDSSEVSNRSSSWLYALMAVVLAIQGVAQSPRQALQTIHVDNNTKRSKTGFYVGILSMFSIFGPFLALVIGGLFSKIPTDFKETSLTPTDPRWVGAWWLGFLVFGGCCILSSLPLFCFPRLRGSDPEPYGTERKVEQERPLHLNLIDLPKSILRLFRNPIFTLSCANGTITLFGIMVMGSFAPKYLETQFFLPSWKANVISGGEKIFATSIGTMVGGILTKRMHLKRTGCLKLIFFTRLMCAILTAFNYMLGCDHPHMYGFDSLRDGNNSLLRDCDCFDTNYLPVCVEGRKTYFSPCHAGCEETMSGGYTKCSLSSTGQATSGICDDSCDFLIPFVIMNLVASLVGTMAIAPYFVVLLSSVNDGDRSLAVGMNSFLMAALVFLPAPLVSGKIFDTVCLVWRSTCGKQGACLLYDSHAMRTKIVSLDFGLKFVAAIMTTFIICLSSRKDIKEAVKEVEINKSKEKVTAL
ncbi:hypothetical protein CHS0354_004901 [Potamilus streckersoni]|uniref:Solute carrier organic anion transporter family member n=1 Tax=Potamilus streckersoni TaxID=2493646 RepID=A0AAE0TIV1_9BIVA|nr:hypothetical protein CHS0354_004901 [Potamilus streckersoni]